MNDSNIISIIGRWIVAVLSGMFTIIQPAIPYFIICIGFVLLDCYSAARLARRVRLKYPGRASGKIRSDKLRHIFRTICEICAVLILIHLAQTYIADGLPFNLTKFVAGMVCGWQFYSFLENSSSCNGYKWAIVAQKILIDKTERHFDIDLSDLNNTAKTSKDYETQSAD